MKNKKGMHLKTRIGIAFFVILLVPVILAGILFLCLANYKVKEFGKKYGIENPTYENLYDQSLMVSRLLDDQIHRIRSETENDQKKLGDNAWLNSKNQELEKLHCFIAIRSENGIYYNGSTTISDEKLMQILPALRETYAASDSSIYIRTADQALIKRMDFEMTDGSRASLFLIAELNRAIPEIKEWLIEVAVCIFLVLALTCLFTSIWIYHSIDIPLHEVKNATRQIRDGNLDYRLDTGSTITEITELGEDFEDMRQRLKESAEEKLEGDKESKELLSNISHDLKTPITAIKGYALGLMDGVANTPEKMDRYVRTIYNKANDMDNLIDELTLYSKIDTNRIPYNFARIHIADYFEDCVEDIRIELQERGIDLIYFNYLHDDAVVIADAEQLKRVINNIISNSVKYMDKPRGVINIRLRDVGDFVQVEIEDNGRGIDQHELTRIFDRFYRTDQSRNSRIRGSGIGLSIVHKIISDHEGKVWATSKKGVGTVIYFVLRKYQEVPETNEQDTDH